MRKGGKKDLNIYIIRVILQPNTHGSQSLLKDEAISQFLEGCRTIAKFLSCQYSHALLIDLTSTAAHMYPDKIPGCHYCNHSYRHSLHLAEVAAER